MFCAWWMIAGSTSPSSGPMCSAMVGPTEDAAIPFQSFARRLISSSPSILSTSTSSISAYAHAASTAESASLDRPFPPPVAEARPRASLWRLIASRREKILLHPAQRQAFFSCSSA